MLPRLSCGGARGHNRGSGVRARWCGPRKRRKGCAMGFSWIPIYRELAEKVLERRNDQQSLLDMMEDGHKAGLKVMDTGGSMTGIDPFSFFASFNRGIKNESRQAIIRFYQERLGLVVGRVP